MKKSSCIVLAVLSLVGNTQGEEKIESLGQRGFASVVVTETNLFLKLPTTGYPLSLSFGANYLERRVLLNPNDEFTLTPDRQAELTDGRHAFTHFTPVIFKNKKKGFKIDDIFLDGDIFNTTDVAYVALSDTPIEVGEDDVEMIMENGEWKKYEKPPPVPKAEDEVQETPPIPDEPVTAAPDETPVNIAEDEQDEGRATASPPSRLWLYAAIALCALSAVLWLARKKRT